MKNSPYSRSMQAFRRASLLWLVIFLELSRASCQAPYRLDQYFHRVWTTADGAPALAYDEAEDDEGVLWLSTSSGLYRFDGTRFAAFQPSANQSAEEAVWRRLRNIDSVWCDLHPPRRGEFLGRVARTSCGSRPIHRRSTRPFALGKYRKAFLCTARRIVASGDCGNPERLCRNDIHQRRNAMVCG